MDIASPLTFLAINITEELVNQFVAFWVLIGMFTVLMLPVIAIPYIFVKMGSVAGKVQGKLNSMGRSARGSATGAAKREAKGAMGRGIERKAGQWAKHAPEGSLRRRAGGYKTHRDFARSQGSAEAKRMQEDALAARIRTDDRYRERAGGIHATAVAQGIQDKRHKEEDDNADAVLRGANIYNPGHWETIARGGQVTGMDAAGNAVNVSGAGDAALQRVAARKIIASQSSDNLNNVLEEGSGADYQMVYSEIQKQYSTAKGGGAHFVKFDPSKPGHANGWSAAEIQKQASAAVSALAPEKFVEQDSGTMDVAIKGVRAKLQDLQSLRAVSSPSPEQGAQMKALEGELKSLATTISSIKGNINTYNKAKEPVRAVIDQLHEIDDLRNMAPPPTVP